jgi:hypothetical protein
MESLCSPRPRSIRFELAMTQPDRGLDASAEALQCTEKSKGIEAITADKMRQGLSERRSIRARRPSGIEAK